MALSFYSVKCPECGANLTVEEGRQKMFCSYCGAQILINNENEHIYHTIDEAKIKEAETERLIRLKELEIEEENNHHRSMIRTVLTYVWIISIFIVGGVCIALWIQDYGGVGIMAALGCLMYAGIPVVGGGAYLIFKILPEKENEKYLIDKKGGIRIPENILPYGTINYQDTESLLRSAGFTNVACISNHYVTSKHRSKYNDLVENITVNGKDLRSAGKVFPADSQIIIKYFGK